MESGVRGDLGMEGCLHAADLEIHLLQLLAPLDQERRTNIQMKL